MGQKIHPTGFRLPVTRNWASRWYASNANFATMLAEDLKVREYLKARLTAMSETGTAERSLEVEALVRNVRASMERATNLGKNISPEVMAIVAGLDDAGRLADLAASNLELKVEDAQSVLDIANTTARLRRVNELLNKEIEVLTVQQEINTQARADIDRSQREFYLRQQM